LESSNYSTKSERVWIVEFPLVDKAKWRIPLRLGLRWRYRIVRTLPIGQEWYLPLAKQVAWAIERPIVDVWRKPF